MSFSATISAATCDVNSNISGNNIDLGSWALASFKTNEKSNFLEVAESEKDFVLQLSGCSNTTDPYKDSSVKLTGSSAWKSYGKFFSDRTTNETGVIIRSGDNIIGNNETVKIKEDGSVTLTATLASTYAKNASIQKGSISVPVTFSYITN